VGAVVANWNGDPFLIPHLKMLRAAGVDRIVLSQGPGPWAKAALFPPCSAYAKEHDGSRDRAAALGFVEIIDNPLSTDFGAHVYNPGLRHLRDDCDMVFRLDSDMFLLPPDAALLVKLVRETDADCVRMDFQASTIDYSGDFDHGTKAAREFDPIAVSPQKLFSGLLDYPAVKTMMVSVPNIVHHFRGWKGFNEWVNGTALDGHGQTRDQIRERFGNHGEFFRCPHPIVVAVRDQTWTF
jgi:hypothetical protein